MEREVREREGGSEFAERRGVWFFVKGAVI